jgi:NitT/TauT family transport system substrate-binding protein
MKYPRINRIFAVGILAIVGIGIGSPVATAQRAEKVVIRTDFTPAGSHAALHLAYAKGWFKDAGLDVDLQDGKGSLNTIQLVGIGEADIGQLSVSTVPAAREAGMKVKSVAAFARRSDLSVIVPKDSAIKVAQDLRGKRLVLFASSPWVPLVDPFLANAGMKREDVTLLFVDSNAMYSTYSVGRADAVLSLAPFALPILEKILPSRAIDAADYGISMPALGLVAREETIATRPEVIRKVVQVTIRAWEYMGSGHVDEAVAAIIKNRPDAKLDPVILAGQANAYLNYFDTPATKGKPVGWQSEEDWKQALVIMQKAGLIKSGMPVQDVYTNDFIADK